MKIAKRDLQIGDVIICQDILSKQELLGIVIAEGIGILEFAGDLSESSVESAESAPDRKEVLLIASMNPDDMTQQGAVYEILRTADGTLHDLLAQHDVTTAKSALLPCFLAGFDSCDVYLSQAIERFLETFRQYAV